MQHYNLSGFMESVRISISIVEKKYSAKAAAILDTIAALNGIETQAKLYLLEALAIELRSN